MNKNLLFILLIWCVSWHTGFSQMIVSDPTANTQRAVGQKLDVVRQKIQASSQILLNAMAGDITGSLEVISEQHEMFKMATELKQTLDDVIITSKSYKLFMGNAELTKQQFKRLESRYRKLLESDGFNPEAIHRVNSTLASATRSYDRSIDTYSKAIDLKDNIDRVTRLENLQKAEKELEDAQAAFDKSEHEIDKLEMLELRKKGLIQDFTAPVGGFILATNPYETQKMNELSKNMLDAAESKSGSRSSIRSQRAKELFDVFFNYGQVLLGIIWVLLILSAFRGKNSIINLVSIGFYTTIGYFILKVVLVNLL